MSKKHSSYPRPQKKCSHFACNRSDSEGSRKVLWRFSEGPINVLWRFSEGSLRLKMKREGFLKVVQVLWSFSKGSLKVLWRFFEGSLWVLWRCFEGSLFTFFIHVPTLTRTRKNCVFCFVLFCFVLCRSVSILAQTTSSLSIGSTGTSSTSTNSTTSTGSTKQYQYVNTSSFSHLAEAFKQTNKQWTMSTSKDKSKGSQPSWWPLPREPVPAWWPTRTGTVTVGSEPKKYWL